MPTLTAYTPDGQTAVVQQPNGEQTTTSYDLADEVTSVVLLSNGTTTTEDTYGYDAAGHTTTHTDADGRMTTTVYDPAGRVTQTTASGGGSTITTATTTVYDPNGNNVSDTVQTTDSTKPGQTQTATHTATYDAEDRQSTETDNGLTTAYTYDAAGQQRGQSVQEGQTAVTTLYDAEGRVTSMSEGAGGAGPYVSTFTYNTNDQVQTVGLPGGVQQSMQYDPNSQLVGVTAGGPNTGAAFTHLSSSYGYTYNGAGQITTMTTLSGTDSLSYDGASRLVNEAAQGTSTQVIAKGGVYHWTYDANGNILTAVDDAGYTTGGITYTNVYTYSTSMPDEIAQMGTTGTAMTKTTSYSYDTRGDVTRIANTAAASDKNALVQTLSYDGQGRVVQVTYLDHSNNNTTTTITLAYNAEGQRAEYDLAQVGAPVLHQSFAYRGGDLAEQTVVSGTTLLYVNTYLYGPQGEPLELLHAQPGQTTARYWYVRDGQGSVVALTDANGVVVDRYAYDQWGEETSTDKTDEHVPQQLRYKGLYYDERISWYWDAGRYYDPETERYLQANKKSGNSITAASISTSIRPHVVEGSAKQNFVYAVDNPSSGKRSCAVLARFELLKGTAIENILGAVGTNHAYVLITDEQRAAKTEATPSNNGAGEKTNISNPGYLDARGPTPFTAAVLNSERANNNACIDFPECTKSCAYYYRLLKNIVSWTNQENIPYFAPGQDLATGLGNNSNAYAYTAIVLLGGRVPRLSPVPAPGWGHILCIGPLKNRAVCGYSAGMPS